MNRHNKFEEKNWRHVIAFSECCSNTDSSTGGTNEQRLQETSRAFVSLKMKEKWKSECLS